MRQELDYSSRPAVTGRLADEALHPLVLDQTLVARLPELSPNYRQQQLGVRPSVPSDGAREMNLTRRRLILLPEALSFVPNLLSRPPDVVSRGAQMFIISNS